MNNLLKNQNLNLYGLKLWVKYRFEIFIEGSKKGKYDPEKKDFFFDDYNETKKYNLLKLSKETEMMYLKETYEKENQFYIADYIFDVYEEEVEKLNFEELELNYLLYWGDEYQN